MMALEGLRVLDLSVLGPGNFTTMILGDLGAEVILIAPPAASSDIRVSMAAYAKDEGADTNPWSMANVLKVLFETFNRNKKHLTLNLKAPKGLDIFYALAKVSDVVLDGFRPGVAERLKVDYNTLKKMNERLIYCSMSGYGHDGPYRDLPGHDINFIAKGGALDMIGSPGGPPAIPMNIVGDWCTSLNAAIGIFAALVARERTGRGQFVDITYLETVLSVTAPFHYDYLNYGTLYRKGETFYNGGNFFYGAYETKDGRYLSVGCNEPVFWKNLCAVLGREDLVPYQNASGEKREEIIAWLKETFLVKTRDEWFEFLKDKNIPVGNVYGIEEVFRDPHIQSRRILEELDLPSGGKVKHIRSPYRLSDTPPKIRAVAPEQGQNTEEILLKIVGLKDKEEVQRLREQNIV